MARRWYGGPCFFLSGKNRREDVYKRQEDACKYTNEYSSTGDVIGNVASNPNCIGYASLSAVDDTVKAVAVNGVTPSEEDVYKRQGPDLLRPGSAFFLSVCPGTPLLKRRSAPSRQDLPLF